MLTPLMSPSYTPRATEIRHSRLNAMHAVSALAADDASCVFSTRHAHFRGGFRPNSPQKPLQGPSVRSGRRQTRGGGGELFQNPRNRPLTTTLDALAGVSARPSGSKYERRKKKKRKRKKNVRSMNGPFGGRAASERSFYDGLFVTASSLQALV